MSGTIQMRLYNKHINRRYRNKSKLDLNSQGSSQGGNNPGSEPDRSIFYNATDCLFTFIVSTCRVKVLSLVSPVFRKPKVILSESSLSQSLSGELLLLGGSSIFERRCKQRSDGRRRGAGVLRTRMRGLNGEWIKGQDTGAIHPILDRSKLFANVGNRSMLSRGRSAKDTAANIGGKHSDIIIAGSHQDGSVG